MTNEARVTHDAYVSIGCDELFYVACDGCPDTIFGPTDNEFEANGKALDHERNPPSKPPPAPSQVHSARDPTVIPPARAGAAWSVGRWESEPPQMQVVPPLDGDGPPVGAYPPGDLVGAGLSQDARQATRTCDPAGSARGLRPLLQVLNLRS